MRQGLWVLPAILAVSCTTPAEHTNPVDPRSPDFSAAGVIEGTVTTFYQPFQPLADVEVHLSPPRAVTFTDSQGRFSFAELAPGAYELRADRDGYLADTIAVTLQRRTRATLSIRLDGLPRLDSLWVHTARVATRPDTTRFLLDVGANVSDPDGAADIQRVMLSVPDFAFADTLAPGGRSGLWQRQFHQEELPDVPLPAWVGHPLRFRLEDAPGATTTAGPFFISRVIEAEPEPLSPVNQEVITASPLRFRWRLPAIAYPYTQEVEIFRLDAGFPTFFAAIRKIASSTTAVTFPGGLPASGNYFWTVKIVDEFGNWSRSKEAAFEVQRR